MIRHSNLNATTKQQEAVKIPANVVTCPTNLQKFIRDTVVAPFVLVFVFIATLAITVSNFTSSRRRCFLFYSGVSNCTIKRTRNSSVSYLAQIILTRERTFYDTGEPNNEPNSNETACEH